MCMREVGDAMVWREGIETGRVCVGRVGKRTERQEVVGASCKARLYGQTGDIRDGVEDDLWVWEHP
jgi:hypothetical protein